MLTVCPPTIPPGWELADQGILEHIKVLEDAGFTVPNWMHDPDVPAVLARIIAGEVTTEVVMVDMIDAWKRQREARLAGPAIDDLRRIAERHMEAFTDKVWVFGQAHNVLTAAMHFASLCPTPHFVADWAIDEARRAA